jgi:hypothetical protein
VNCAPWDEKWKRAAFDKIEVNKLRASLSLHSKREMKMKKKYLLFSMCMISLLSLFLIALPVFVEHQLVRQLESILNRSVSLDDVDLNLFTLEFRLEKLEIQEISSNNCFASFEEFYLNASWRSLFKQSIIIEKIHLNRPNLNAAMKSDSTFNFSDLIAEPQQFTKTSIPSHQNSKKQTFEMDKLPVNFDIQNVSIQNGRITFKDHKHGLTHSLNQLNFSFPQLTNIPMTTDQPAEITLNFIINNCYVQTHTQANLFHETPVANIHFTNHGGNLSFYQPYLNEYIDWNISSGELKTNLNAALKLTNNIPDLTLQGNVKIVDFELKERQQNKLITFPLLELQLDTSRPIKSIINLASIRLIQPEINIIRRKDQSINIVPAVTKGSFDHSKRHVKNAATSGIKQPASQSSSVSTNTMDINIQKVLIEKGQIGFHDISLTPTFKTQLKQFEVMLNGVSLKDQKISAIHFKTEISPRGNVSIKGALQLSPQKWDGHVLVEDVDISMVHPYLKEFMNGHLESGRLFIESDTHFEQKNHAPHVQFSGNIALKDFMYTDPDNAKDALSFKNLEINKINSGLSPHYLDIDEIRLDHFIAPIILLKDGQLNWVALIKEKDTQKTIEHANSTHNEKSPMIAPSKIEPSITSAPTEASNQTQTNRTSNVSTTQKPLFQRFNKTAKFVLSIEQ